MALRTELVDTLAGAEAIADPWDDLAQASGRPYCAPGWLLPWWRHVAPAGSELRIVVVWDGEALVGVAPLYAMRWRGVWLYALLGTSVSSRVEPLVRDADVARAFATALAAARPAPAVVQLSGVPAASAWGEQLAAAWPGRAPFVHRRPDVGAPTVTLGAADVDTWLSGRSSNFRSQMRRFRRRLEEAGAAFRVTERPDELARDLAEFERLHRGRRETRGGTTAFPAGAMEMLTDAGRELLDDRRFRLATIEIDGRPIASHLFLSAGSEVTYWNGGFDDDYGNLRPAYVALVDAVGAAIEGGHERLDLGPGTQDYKARFADGGDELETVTLIPRGLSNARGRLAYAPNQARAAIGERLDDEQKERLRKLAGRVRRRPKAD